jgi:hypothetical protein
MGKKTVSPAAVIAASVKRNTRIPPDPEEMNERRSDAAEAVLYSFAKGDLGEFISYEDKNGKETGVMLKEMVTQNLSDLICNFAHYCDRNNIRISSIISNAQFHYDEETGNKGKQFHPEL